MKFRSLNSNQWSKSKVSAWREVRPLSHACQLPWKEFLKAFDTFQRQVSKAVHMPCCRCPKAEEGTAQQDLSPLSLANFTKWGCVTTSCVLLLSLDIFSFCHLLEGVFFPLWIVHRSVINKISIDKSKQFWLLLFIFRFYLAYCQHKLYYCLSKWFKCIVVNARINIKIRHSIFRLGW